MEVRIPTRTWNGHAIANRREEVVLTALAESDGCVTTLGVGRPFECYVHGVRNDYAGGVWVDYGRAEKKHVLLCRECVADFEKRRVPGVAVES